MSRVDARRRVWGTRSYPRAEFLVAKVRNKRSYLRAVVPAAYQMPQPLRDGAT